ncbi:hypothetical protein IV203_018291 [Nitzschia inconspicua]|uniref:Uncharacterized protein n=1 Tax=Nitzschia inconspicua TaxID=303405 RepID=A0A9K3Q5T2_9STRA|nr:hypothetical protein IV203_018291 [Nitzschia inconspicua]
MSEQPPKRRKCGACKGARHDRRNCPALRATKANNLAIPAVENRNGVDGGPSRLPIGATMPEITPNINWDQLCYVLFDLETTGGSRTKDVCKHRTYHVEIRLPELDGAPDFDWRQEHNR